MVGAEVPDPSALPKEPCPELPKPVTEGTELRSCWTVMEAVASMLSRSTVMTLSPTGAAMPRMAVPVTTTLSIWLSATVVWANAAVAHMAASPITADPCRKRVENLFERKVWLELFMGFPLIERF